MQREVLNNFLKEELALFIFSMYNSKSRHFKYGALAQLGERIAGSDEVRGSIPLGSITKR